MRTGPRRWRALRSRHVLLVLLWPSASSTLEERCGRQLARYHPYLCVMNISWFRSLLTLVSA
jgi:hypothetical protein